MSRTRNSSPEPERYEWDGQDFESQNAWASWLAESIANNAAIDAAAEALPVHAAAPELMFEDEIAMDELCRPIALYVRS